MQRLVRLLSFNSYFLLANGVGLALAVLLIRDGVTTLDALVVIAYALGAGFAARRLRAPKQSVRRFDAMAAFDQALRDPRPTLLEFYSDYCAVCMAMRPVMRRLEQDAAHRLQILRVSVNDRVGLQLADRYDVALTPTFLLLTAAGAKDEAFTFFLDRSRVLYWLDQQTISAPLPGVTPS